ncbi:MAG: hypothetical protein M3O88_02245, partial [Actinomycetota bacterium]|nr:hypothetical protein [Actinomycetota bacterium]
MLSTRDGWILTSRRLLVTSNGGGSWEDRTPPRVSSFQDQVAAGFADPRHGLIADIVPARYGRPSRVNLFRTADGGVRWQESDFPITQTSSYESFVDPVTVGLSSPRHGWFSVGLVGYMAMDYGALLYRTGDGGATWRFVTTVPVSGGVSFSSPKTGWALYGQAPGSMTMGGA